MIVNLKTNNYKTCLLGLTIVEVTVNTGIIVKWVSFDY